MHTHRLTVSQKRDVRQCRGLQNPLLLLLLGIGLVFGAACTSTQAAPLPYVDLSQRAPLPAIAALKVIPLRIAVAAIISPQGTVESYSELANYLGNQLGRPIQIVQRRTYAEVNDLIATHAVDLAFVCTSAYIDGHDQFGMELLVAPEINGVSVYYSELIVPMTSPARTMADLRGKVFAFTDPISFSGRVYPSYLVEQLHETPAQFFGRTFFTYSHDRAIEAVAAGVADGAAIDSLVLQYALARKPPLKTRIRVIHRSPPFGIPPVVVPPAYSPHYKRQLQEILLAMDESPAGRQILATLGITRFVLIEDQAYANARHLVKQVGTQP
jgi:phosphonate transport system substrate-binding protein